MVIYSIFGLSATADEIINGKWQFHNGLVIKGDDFLWTSANGNTFLLDHSTNNARVNMQLLMNGTNMINFGNTGAGINSLINNQLDVFATQQTNFRIGGAKNIEMILQADKLFLRSAATLNSGFDWSNNFILSVFVRGANQFAFLDGFLNPSIDNDIEVGTVNFKYKKMQSYLTVFGTATDRMEMQAGGKQVFIGSAGLVFGGMGQENIPTTITLGTAGVAVIVDGMSAHETNNVTFQNSQELKVLKAGKYSVVWSVSFNMASGAGQECEGRIGINGTAQARGSAHRKIGAGNDTGNMCGSAIIDLDADDLITVMVENESSTVNIIVAHASLILQQVGGT